MILLDSIYARITNKYLPHLEGAIRGVNETLPHPPKPRGGYPYSLGG
jgi:hypothetical protein